jgi:type I restriction enzyme R subunit
MAEGPSPAAVALRDLRGRFADHLREAVVGMNLDNFLVRPHRRLVEKFVAPIAWEHLGLEDQAELTGTLAALPTSFTDDDVEAKAFDLIVLRAELALLRADATFEDLKGKIIEIVALLEEKSNIPMVAAHLPLIEEVQTATWWEGVTAPMLDSARLKLRGLIKLIDTRGRNIVYTDFEDEIGPGAEIELTGLSMGVDVARFRAKARLFLREHENHIAVAKLRRNEPLTPTDLAELERIFLAEGVAQQEDLDRVRDEGGLGLFIRSLVGLDREAAQAAFAGFLAARTLTANQIEFIDTIVDHLTANGQMDPGLLYESPFTDFDPLGVAGVFLDEDAKGVVAILDEVRRRAAA